MLEIKVVNKGKQPLPTYATEGSVGMDLRADIDEPVTLDSLERHLFPTGLHIAIKHGITCLNSPGTIDSDYRGDVGVELVNLSKEPYTIYPGERIAQMVINKTERIEFKLVEELDETKRGEGGFGHTGKQ